jgi:hypothetical protein
MGEGSADPYLEQVPDTTIEYQGRFWRVQMSTPHYESAISCVARPSSGTLRNENMQFYNAQNSGGDNQCLCGSYRHILREFYNRRKTGHSG